MILAYRVFTNLLYPFLFIFLYVRVLLNKEDSSRYKEKILVKNFNIKRNYHKKLLWFHAVSIGEFKSILPLIEKINNQRNNYEFLITTSTLSSSELAKIELRKFNNVLHRFMPLDVNHLIENFFILWRPAKVFLVDSEIWPNLILMAKRKKIPIALINARITKKSFNKWLIFSKTAKKLFRIFSLCLCSNKETKNFLNKLKVNNVKYVGNIKLINLINKKKLNDKDKKILSNARFWIASSIHKEEDIFCLKTHVELKKKFNDIKTIIAPRHLDRVKKIKSLSEDLNLKVKILNYEDKIKNDAEIFIVNSFGILQDYYQYATSVFIGKSMIEKLKNDSGQNPLDAALLNCKIYHGPHVSNFHEIYEILKENKISKQVENYNELSKNLVIDLENLKKKESAYSNSIKSMREKVLSNTMEIIYKFLNDKF